VALKLVSERRAWWPVTFPGVTEEGEVVENCFQMRFRLHGEDEHVAVMTRVALLRGRAEQQAREQLGEAADADAVRDWGQTILSTLYGELVREIAVDWKDVLAENGDPLKFEPEHVRQVMNIGGAFEATLRAYQACRRGGREIREGN
jgi:hypothetical protein